MNEPAVRPTRLIDRPVGRLPRALLVTAAVLTLSVAVFPLWSLTMFAPQYPDGLRLYIYSYKLDGDNAGQDVKEINVLNHYIGMRDLVTADFGEFKWMPFVVGALALLFLRAAVHAHLGDLLDVTVLYLYFALFSLWSFGYKMYHYGHDLAPTAAVKVEPFMPPMFGYKKLANFDVWSYPGVASYALMAIGVALLLALAMAWRQARREGPAV
jgi:hypothetical protein